MNAPTAIAPPRFNLLAAICAGIVAGIIFIGLQMLLIWWLAGKSPWGPEHVIAAIVMGTGVLPKSGAPPPGVTPLVFAVGLAIHFILSIIYACILSWMIGGTRRFNAVALGITFGFALYFVDFYLFTNVFPWFAHSRGPITIFTHVMFGAVAALIYASWMPPEPVEA